MNAYKKPPGLLTKQYWLDAPDGRVIIGAWAVLVGRSPDCNIVIEQPEVSRHHLLVRLGQRGPEMLPLGREGVRLNGEERAGLTPLHAGDRIVVGQWSFTVREGEVEYQARARDTAWCLERQTGLLHLVTGPTFRVGGGASDDLIVEGWEPTVFTLSMRTGDPVLTALLPGVSCRYVLEVGERIPLENDARITYRSESMRLRARRAYADAPVQTWPPPVSAPVVMLEFLPRGGRLTIDAEGKVRSAHLSDRRCDLMACLLHPPSPFVAGDFIPEEVVCRRIWPGEKSGRLELNSLLYRLRQSLSEDGIDPAPLFERRGGGLRFCLAPNARVVVR